MKVLFIHQNFPGQFKHLAHTLAENPANRVVALHMRRDAFALGNVRLRPYVCEQGTTPGTPGWLNRIETLVVRGNAARLAAENLRREGFTPDVVCAHPGWGEALFVKDVWPQARLLCYFEYFYRNKLAGFDPEYPLQTKDAHLLRLDNFHNLFALESCDAGLSPTMWQRGTYPSEYERKIRVVHDGIDTISIVPSRDTVINLAGSGATLTSGDEIVTYAARNLEPVRGFHVFMRALPRILSKRPNARILIVGGDKTSYSIQSGKNKTYRQRLIDEMGSALDLKRIHFLGHLPYEQYLGVLRISSVHVYLTYPFVLSWSMLEAMSAGCLVVGSRTPPVEEVIQDGANGLLFDFFDQEGLAERVIEALHDREKFQPLRVAARRTIIERYDLRAVCLPRQIKLIEALASSG